MSVQSQLVKDWRQRSKIIIIAAMGGCCQVCKYDRCRRALELHHVDAQAKDISFSALTSHCRNWEFIREEMMKCILLCSNCHREIHAGITAIPAQYAKFDNDIASSMRESILAPARECRATKKSLVDSLNHSVSGRRKSRSQVLHSATYASPARKIAGRRRTVTHSKIDFSKFGWASLLAKDFGISSQKVVQWMKRHMPDFYEGNCHKNQMASQATVG